MQKLFTQESYIRHAKYPYTGIFIKTGMGRILTKEYSKNPPYPSDHVALVTWARGKKGKKLKAND